MTSAQDGFDVVTFLSDFGRSDVFVGVCHGVIVQRAPHARVIDLTHDVAAHDVEHGAVLLSRAVEHLPVAVHLAVVDPGVGTDRRGVAITVERGDVLVGPDNGLLLPAAEVLGGVDGAYELARESVTRASATFHGRDVFAPAAAAIAAGTAPGTLGPAVHDLRALEVEAARVDGDARELEARVVLVDRFGNLQLDARAGAIDELRLREGDTVTVTVAAADLAADARVVRTFGELAPGELGLYPDSDRRVALAVNAGSASERLRAGRGMRITVRPVVLADGPEG